MWPICLYFYCTRGLGGMLTLLWSYCLNFAQLFHLFHVRPMLFLHFINCGVHFRAYLQQQQWQNEKQGPHRPNSHDFQPISHFQRQDVESWCPLSLPHLSFHLSSEILIIISLACWTRSFFPDVLLLFSWAFTPSNSDHFTISRVWLSLVTSGIYCLAILFLNEIAFSR